MHYARISLLPLPGQLQRFLRRRIFQSAYAGNTFINHSSYQGRLKENTQLGAELIGVDSIEADAEMLAMVVDGLKKTGLKEFQVSIGHVDFIQSLFLAAGLEEDEAEELRTLIANRNFFGVE